MCREVSQNLRACPGRNPRHSHCGAEPRSRGYQLAALLFMTGVGGVDAAGVARASSRWRPVRMTAWRAWHGRPSWSPACRVSVCMHQLTAITVSGQAGSSCLACRCTSHSLPHLEQSLDMLPLARGRHALALLSNRKGWLYLCCMLRMMLRDSTQNWACGQAARLASLMSWMLNRE